MNRRITRRTFVAAATAGGTLAAADSITAARATGAEQEDARLDDLVADASAPMASPSRGLDALRRELQARRAAGFDLVFAPVAGRENLEASLRNAAALQNHMARLTDDALLVMHAEDLTRVRPRVGVIACFQGLQMIGEQLGLIADFRAAGVTVMQLTGYWKNWNGDGCFERGDVPLTGLGRMAVRAIADAGVVLDLAQAGRRTSLEALERTTGAVIVSRANAARVYAHPQNLTDEQIDAVRGRGGVIGVTAFPALLSSSARPTLDDVFRHLEYLVERAGEDHVGIGLDFDDRPRRRFPDDPLPDPPYPYPAGLASPADLLAFRSHLETRGFSNSAIQKLLGGNLVRLLSRALRVR